jgi:uncharacterized protein YaiE (UPF0345 family)
MSEMRTYFFAGARHGGFSLREAGRKSIGRLSKSKVFFFKVLPNNEELLVGVPKARLPCRRHPIGQRHQMLAPQPLAGK